MNSTGLRALARLYGIQTAYYDINKQRTEARSETLLSSLQSLGAPIAPWPGARMSKSMASRRFRESIQSSM